MKTITIDRIHEQDRQEELPDYSEDFPCIISRAEIDKYPQHYVPWHWHQPIELFYIESGELEYHTPGGVTRFPTGTGGLVNSGIIHMTQPHTEKGETVQLLHIFNPFFLADSPQGRISRLYLLPYLNSNVEILSFSPSIPKQRELLSMLRDSFQIDENQIGFEITLRAALSAIWLKILDVMPEACRITIDKNVNECLKRMLNYIHTHFSEGIRIADVAAQGLISERECYRLFQSRIQCSPNAYITGYRLEKACALLRGSEESMTLISQICGFGSSSHFGKLFAERYGCTPRQYRQNWQNIEKNRR